MSTGENAIFHVKILACDKCEGEYEAEFDAEGSSAYIEWVCKQPRKEQPILSGFINGQVVGQILCGYENSKEVEL